jgi:hypothetical protein
VQEAIGQGIVGDVTPKTAIAGAVDVTHAPDTRGMRTS